MAGDVGGQEIQEGAQRRVIAFRAGRTRQHDFAIGADRVVELVALAQLEGAPDGFRDGGLVAVGERGFGFEHGGHCGLRSGLGCSAW